MDRLERLEQVVKKAEELLAEVQALKGEGEVISTDFCHNNKPKTVEEVILHIEQNGGVWACVDTRDEMKNEPYVYIFKNKENGVIVHGPIEDIPLENRSFILWVI